MNRARKTLDSGSWEGRVATRLLFLRERAGLSQQQVAMAVGLKSVDSVFKWESADAVPSVRVFPILRELYGLQSEREVLPEEENPK
jgi:Predicted transcription factor, homolog of eukaryotic MBF1